MKIKKFLFRFIIVYLLLSIPALLEIGYVIDWVPEATFAQKFSGIVMEDLTRHALIKSILAAIISIFLSLFFSKHNARKGH